MLKIKETRFGVKMSPCDVSAAPFVLRVKVVENFLLLFPSKLEAT